MMPSRKLLGAGLLTAAAACTPLGLWVYDDPGLEVSRVRLDHAAAGAAPVVVGLAVWNPNDYDLSTARLELQLRLDGVAVGHFSRDSIIPVPQSGLADFALPLTVPAGPIRERIRRLSSGTHRFAVVGRATFSTPFGRRDVRFAHAGDMAFGGGNELGVGSALSADSVRVRRGPYAPRLPSVRPMPDQGPHEVSRGGGGREPR
jgi:LEA14-like dessication related protein